MARLCMLVLVSVVGVVCLIWLTTTLDGIVTVVAWPAQAVKRQHKARCIDAIRIKYRAFCATFTNYTFPFISSSFS